MIDAQTIEASQHHTGGQAASFKSTLADSALALPTVRGRRLTDAPGVIHGLTRRVAGMGLADGNVAYSAPRDQHDAWAMRRRWCFAIGVDPERLATLGQIHGADVLHVRAVDAGRGARPGTRVLGYGDALITDEPGVALMTLHADCLPILVFDPARPAVAAVHAGWRSTVADIVGATIAAMTTAYGTQPANVLVYVGPGIGACCNHVRDDVIDAWRERAGGDADLAFGAADGQVTFDGRAANRLLLHRAGVAADNVEVSDICTRCQGETWFSHRGQGPTTGRFGAIIALDPSDDETHDLVADDPPIDGASQA